MIGRSTKRFGEFPGLFFKKTQSLPEVDQSELNAWKEAVRRKTPANCPSEVETFIEALSKKLPDFGQMGIEKTTITGEELLLCGIKVHKGEQVNRFDLYPLTFPKMVALDHYSAMHRIFEKRGKQGLIDYMKSKMKGTELDRAIEILNVHVFHEEREEFQRVLHQINQSKKIESELPV